MKTKWLRILSRVRQNRLQNASTSGEAAADPVRLDNDIIKNRSEFLGCMQGWQDHDLAGESAYMMPGWITIQRRASPRFNEECLAIEDAMEWSALDRLRRDAQAGDVRAAQWMARHKIAPAKSVQKYTEPIRFEGQSSSLHPDVMQAFDDAMSGLSPEDRLKYA